MRLSTPCAYVVVAPYTVILITRVVLKNDTETVDATNGMLIMLEIIGPVNCSVH